MTQHRRGIRVPWGKTPRSENEADVLRRRLRKARRRAEELERKVTRLRAEQQATRRSLRELRTAASWLDPDGSTDAGSSAAGIRARAAAAGFVEALALGSGPAEALVAYARNLAQLPRHPYRYRLPELARALEDVPGLAPGVHAALAVHGLHDQHPARARHHLALCGPDAPRLIPAEYARITLDADPTAADEVLDALVARATPTAGQWLDILAAIAATGDLATLARAVAEVQEGADEWQAGERRVLARFAEYGERANAEPTKPTAPVVFGVIGYRQADLRSSSWNIGDFTQTVAALGHLLRRRGVRFNGDPELVDAAEDLRSRIRPDLLLEGDDATVELVEVSRDESRLDDVPPGTWMLAFGWHLHSDGLDRYGLPYHPNLRPIFVAFHCNRRDMLSDDAVEYLRRYAPIGCRDWYTVDLLTYLGVPAFFTGCVTSTIDGYFDGPPPDGDRPEGFVDVRPPAGGTPLRQAYEEVRDRRLGDNLHAALATLDEYRDRFGSLTTSRLHCYLPTTSIGIPTTFRPRRRFDVRFEGLADGSADLPAMRSLIRDTLLEPVLAAVVSGAPEDDVYALWRSITEPMVAADTAARATAYDWPGRTVDAAAAVDAVKQRSWVREVPSAAEDRVVDLCVVLDRAYLTQLYTVVDRCLAHTERPLRLWALARGLDTADFERFAAAFPEVGVTFLPCDDVDHGEVLVRAPHISVSTMDRLLLPDLLADIGKVLYLDLDLLPRDDIGLLYDTPLRDSPLAARPNLSMEIMGGVVGLVGIAHTRFPDSDQGWRLLNLAHRRSGIGDVGFNAGVLVMNLHRMREDDFFGRYSGFVGEFGLNDQYVLNLYAGSSYVELDRHWNAWPDRDQRDEGVGIVHWLGPMKPWHEVRLDFQDEWRSAVAAMLERRGGPGDAPTGRHPQAAGGEPVG